MYGVKKTIDAKMQLYHPKVVGVQDGNKNSLYSVLNLVEAVVEPDVEFDVELGLESILEPVLVEPEVEPMVGPVMSQFKFQENLVLLGQRQLL